MARRLPTGKAWQTLVITYGPMIAPYLRRLYEQGRWRQLAIAHARTLLGGTFSDERISGQRHWVVWAGDRPVAAYPETDADLQRALSQARPDRRRDPDELPLPTVLRSAAQRSRALRDRARSVTPIARGRSPDDDLSG